jgi:FixJ family two-component response regulator
MPGLSGIQLQKQPCRFSPGTKVIIITGRPDSEIRTLALTGGAFGFLVKPIDDEAFFRSCGRHLGNEEFPLPSLARRNHQLNGHIHSANRKNYR